MKISNFKIDFLSNRLFRIQKGNFTDKCTQVVIHRKQIEDVDVAYNKTSKYHIFKTSDIKVKVDEKGNVSSIIFLNNNKSVKDFYSYNLKGTARTLDMVNGSCELSDGLISKNGVAILDDSKSLLLENNLLKERKKCKDLYFFCFQDDYQEAINQFYKLTGNVPLIPRFALGNWWSRYHAYSDEEYLKLINDFEKNNIPISVSVIDMDWHHVDIINNFYDENIDESSPYYDGWTGYTWNEKLFKDYKSFLKTLKDKNLKVTLNLHPSLGVRKWEAMFEKFASSLNIDPNNTKIIPFDISNPKFIKSYFEILHHPYEKDGVDFWWIDWQQGETSNMKDLDPLWALNHYHYNDNDKTDKRPLVLSRYSGPGSHRYPLGFSGDTWMTWDSLKFQPYFTLTASNIGYTWWSHDIGGHCCGYKDNELYIRWIQLGVFSPINRLHSTNDPFTGKEPWKQIKSVKDISIKYLQLRKKLIPYLYSMNYQTYSKGKALVEPLYYSIKDNNAYKFKNEFFFGSELLVSPIVEKTNKITCLASSKTYIPKGRWTDIFTNLIYEGDKVLSLYRSLSYIPVLAKQGAIIPIYVDGISNNINNNQDLEILVYRGNNSFDLYEDDGESKEYLKGKYSIKTLIVREKTNKVTFTIKANSNKNYNINYNRNLIISFKDVVKGNISCNVDYKLLDDEFIKIEVKDVDKDIVIKINDATYLVNKNKKESLIDLISSYQMDNITRAEMFCNIINDINYNIKAPKYLLEPIQEILKMDK